MNTVNFWAILVAAVVAFVIGGLWYSPILFGKEYMALIGTTEKDIEVAKAKGGMWKLYVAQFVFAVITFGVLGFFISSASGVTASDGALMGFLAWLGFEATVIAGGYLWEKKPMKLVVIQATCSLLTLVIGGAIIGVWH